MADGRDDSRLAWLVEPQRRDVALRQPLVTSTTTATRADVGAEVGDSVPARFASDASSPASTESMDAAHAWARDAQEPDEDATLAALAGERPLSRQAASNQSASATALEPRRTPLSMRLITIVRGSGKTAGTLGAPRRARPMSFAARFIIAMVATMSIFTALAVASPVAAGTPFHGTFDSLAGAAPWIPTPTPTPRPTPTPAPPAGGRGPLPYGPLPPPPRQPNPGAAVVQSYIRQVFGQWSGQALAVANCESGYDPNAWNPYELLNSHAAGVFQILYTSTWAETPYWSDNPFDYRLNIQGAYWLFSRDGHTWREWACGTILGYN